MLGLKLIRVSKRGPRCGRQPILGWFIKVSNYVIQIQWYVCNSNMSKMNINLKYLLYYSAQNTTIGFTHTSHTDISGILMIV